MSTSFQEAAGQVNAPMVRSALEIAAKDFERRGVAGGTASLVRIQQMVIFHFVVLRYYTVIYPEHPLPDFGIELGAALVALQDELRCQGIPKEK